MFELFSKTTGMGKMKRKLVLGAKNERFYYVHVERIFSTKVNFYI